MLVSFVPRGRPAPPTGAAASLRAAAQNVSDRRTLMDDGFWVSQKEMNALDAALAADTEGLDALAAIEAEHLWCVKVDGDYALRHEPEAHRPKAEFVIARLAKETRRG